MPPKEAKPKPLTKKQKRELAARLKEEEEQKRKEEEERRRLIEEEEERKRIAEEKRLAEEEEKRLREEILKNEEWVLTVKKTRQVMDSEIKIQYDWCKYKICNEQPDPDKDYQITTFITQYKETPVVQGLKIQEALDQMQISELIVSDIYELAMKSMAEGRKDDSQKYLEYIKTIRDITCKKLEECTSDLTKNSEYLTDERAEEIKKQQEEYGGGKQIKIDQKQQYEVYKIYKNQNDLRYGMWINPNSKGSYRHKPIEFGETLMAMEVPSRLMHVAFLMKATWTSFDNFSNPNLYSKYRVVGGVLDIECIERPPVQTKSAQWSLKHDYEVKDSIKKLNSTQDGQGGQTSLLQPVKMHYPLPQYLKIFPGQRHKLAVYEEHTQQWNPDLIQDIQYDDQKKLLVFKTQKVGPISYLQERCTEYPYQKFFIRAIDDQRVLIDIMAIRDTYKFEIGPGYALLKKNESHPELESIWEKKLPVGSLLHFLDKSGINLMPCDEDAATATLKKKNDKTEDLAIQDICRGIRSFFIRSSAFSFQLHPDKILCRIRENPEYDDQTYGEDQEKDWKSVCWFPNKSAVLRARDTGDFCDERFLPDTVAHINLEYTLKEHELTTDWALKRMRDTDYIVMEDTLAQFLKLTHLLTFTVFEQERREENDEEINEGDQQKNTELDEQQQENQNEEQQGQQQQNTNGSQAQLDQQQQSANKLP